jgi:UDP-glucose 4-epimerase
MRQVIITGIAGQLGRLVCRRLHREEGLVILGVDRRPFPDRPRDVTHIQADLRSKRTLELMFQSLRHRAEGPDEGFALLHLGLMHDPRRGADEGHEWNISGTARLLDACAQAGVRKVVVLSSANIYGPRPDNPQFLTEDAPLLGAQHDPAMRDLIEVDMLASSFFWKHSAIETVILRPVHILGRVHNAPSNYLRLKRVPVLLGYDPMVQVVHEEDVVEAIMLALRPGVRGIFNITGPGELPLSAILRELGRQTLPVPHPLAAQLLRLLFRGKLSSFPAAELDHIRFTCMADGSRAERVLGYRAQRSLKETIHAVDQV